MKVVARFLAFPSRFYLLIILAPHLENSNTPSIFDTPTPINLPSQSSKESKLAPTLPQTVPHQMTRRRRQPNSAISTDSEAQGAPRPHVEQHDGVENRMPPCRTTRGHGSLNTTMSNDMEVQSTNAQPLPVERHEDGNRTPTYRTI